MEFDKSRVYTALNADELKVGSRVILADGLAELKEHVKLDYDADRLTLVRSEGYSARFSDGYSYWHLAYLVSEPEEKKPEEKKLEWTDLKVGDVIRCDGCHRMVTGIDTYETNAHIYIGEWLKDDALENWEKVDKDEADVF